MSELKKTVRRDLSLWSVRAWQRGYHEEFPKIFGWKYPILFHYDGTRVTFYHRLADFRHFKDVITKRVIEDDELFDRLNHSFLKYLEVLHTHMIAPTIDNLPELETVVGRIMSFYLFVVSDAFVAARPEAWEARRRSEGVLYTLDEQVEAGQIERLRSAKRKRDSRAVRRDLDDLKAACKTGQNVMPFCIAAVKDMATVQEICDVYREVFGEYRDPGLY